VIKWVSDVCLVQQHRDSECARTWRVWSRPVNEEAVWLYLSQLSAQSRRRSVCTTSREVYGHGCRCHTYSSAQVCPLPLISLIVIVRCTCNALKGSHSPGESGNWGGQRKSGNWGGQGKSEGILSVLTENVAVILFQAGKMMSYFGFLVFISLFLNWNCLRICFKS